MRQVIREGNCMKCGYDLTGLDLVGRCPECGNEYDGHSRAGFASAAAMRQAQLDRKLGRLRTGCLLALTVTALALAGLMIIIGWGNPTRALVAGIILAGFFGLATLLSYMGERSDPS